MHFLQSSLLLLHLLLFGISNAVLSCCCEDFSSDVGSCRKDDWCNESANHCTGNCQGVWNAGECMFPTHCSATESNSCTACGGRWTCVEEFTSEPTVFPSESPSFGPSAARQTSLFSSICSCAQYRNDASDSASRLCQGLEESWGSPCYPMNEESDQPLCNEDMQLCENHNVGACRPCAEGEDEGCTSGSTTTQAWCNTRCTSGLNDPLLCPRSHCTCTSDIEMCNVEQCHILEDTETYCDRDTAPYVCMSTLPGQDDNDVKACNGDPNHWPQSGMCPKSCDMRSCNFTSIPSNSPSVHSNPPTISPSTSLPSVAPSSSPSTSSATYVDEAAASSVTTPVAVATVVSSVSHTASVGGTVSTQATHTVSPSTYLLHVLLSYCQLFGLIAIFITDKSANNVHQFFIEVCKTFSGYYSYVENHELSFTIWFFASCILAYVLSRVLRLDPQPSSSIYMVYNFFYLPASCLFLNCMQSIQDAGDIVFIIMASIILILLPIIDVINGSIGMIKYYDILIGVPCFILFRWFSHILRAFFLTVSFLDPHEKVSILCGLELVVLFIMIYLQPYYNQSGWVFLYECFALFLTSIIYILYYLDHMEILMGCQIAIAGCYALLFMFLGLQWIQRKRTNSQEYKSRFFPIMTTVNGDLFSNLLNTDATYDWSMQSSLQV